MLFAPVTFGGSRLALFAVETPFLSRQVCDKAGGPKLGSCTAAGEGMMTIFKGASSASLVPFDGTA